jgi:hypothetical protein
MRLDDPVWRIVGSAASWLLFSFAFTLFCLGLYGVLQVGGTCAEGGPFVIAVHCPENTDVFTLGGVYGGLAALFINLFVARTFGTRILLAWTILFGTLSLPFLLVGGSTLPSGITFLLIGLFTVAMAVAPLVIEARAAGLQRTFLGVADASGRRFRERDDARSSMFVPGQPNPQDAVVATARDWATSLGLWLGTGAVGVLLALLVFNAA